MRRRIHVRPRFFIMAIVIMALVFGAGHIAAQRSLAAGARQLSLLQEQTIALSMQIAETKEEIDFAQTDDYILRIAREELGLILPGEIRYVASSGSAY